MKVLIKSADASFRRAGLQFTRDGAVIDIAELTEEQREAIAAEPRLSITPVAEDGEGAVKSAPAKSKK